MISEHKKIYFIFASITFYPARGIRLVCERGRPFHLCKQCNHKVKHHFSHTTFAHFIIVRLLVFHILFIFSSTFSTIIPSVLSMPLRLWLTLYPYSSPPSPNAIYFAAMALSVYDCVCFCREAERWPWWYRISKVTFRRFCVISWIYTFYSMALNGHHLQ